MYQIFQGNASRLKNEMIWIYGWGKNEKGQISNQLMKTNVAVTEIVDDSVYLELIQRPISINFDVSLNQFN